MTTGTTVTITNPHDPFYNKEGIIIKHDKEDYILPYLIKIGRISTWFNKEELIVKGK